MVRTRLALALALLATLPSQGAPAPAPWSRPWVPLGGDYWKNTEPKQTDAARAPVWGIADLHAHYFTYLAYGGRIFHGKAFAPGGIAEALHDCADDHGHGFGGNSLAITPEGTHRTNGYPNFEGWPKFNSLVHQQAYVDWIRRAWQGGLRVVQMDIQNTAFLGRAYKVINRPFIRGKMTPLPLDDVSALRLQSAAARELFEKGPAKDFAAIAHSPEEARAIVESGKLAVILGIEVEAIGNLLTRESLGADPRAKIREVLNDLWNEGVRHVIPIHLTRNAFGHPAFFERTLNASNYAETGDWYDLGEGFDHGIRFDARSTPANPVSWFFELWGRLHGKRANPLVKAAMARTGLTPEGELLIVEMMRKGFLIDLEHMSEIATRRTLELAERENVPLQASHGGFRELSFGNTLTYAADGSFSAKLLELPFADAKHGEYGTSDPRKTPSERAHSVDVIRRISKLGGMVGVGVSASSTGVAWRDRVPNDCDGSSKSFVQQILYANDVMGGQGVALGTDVSGFSPLPAPRFGVNACPALRGDAVRSAGGRGRAQALAQRNGVRYSSPVASVGSWRFEHHKESAYTSAETKLWELLARAKAEGKTASTDTLASRMWSSMEEGPNAPLDRSRAGTREWDINLDGVAHYGLLPDFLQDAANVLRASGAGDELAPLFQSAEYYLKMWEKIDAQARRMAAQ